MIQELLYGSSIINNLDLLIIFILIMAAGFVIGVGYCADREKEKEKKEPTDDESFETDGVIYRSWWRKK